VPDFSKHDEQPQPPYGQPAPPSYGAPTPTYGQPALYYGAPAPHHGPPASPPAVQPGYQQAYGYPVPSGNGPTGKIRGTGVAILLTIVTFGIYPLYWYYVVHDEMKRHTGQGLGGGLAVLIAFFIGVVVPFITANEVGELYTRRGWRPPVSGATGLWYFPGAFILVGPLVWFVKTNGALNAYWRALGAS
jgi:hypothetical protein